MKEQHIAIDTLLVNTVEKKAQRVQSTAESIQHVINAGGLPQAMSMGIEMKLVEPKQTIPFNEVLVVLSPTIQDAPNIQN